MKRRIGVATVVLAGGIALGCEGRQPLAPAVTGQLFAAATTKNITATATLTPMAPRKHWVSDGISHIRDQTQTGPVIGDIKGSVTVVGRSDVEVATMTGTGSGKFTITVTSGGSWEGSFEGRFDAGLFSGKLVAQGTGALSGRILRGSISQTAPNRIYFLAGTILTTGS
jgi:hypothetical protein